MKLNQWTLGLAALGVISLPSVVQAEEAQHQVLTALASTTLSGYVDTSAIWQVGRQTGTAGALYGRSFDGTGKQDGFNLNVVKLQLAKPLDEGQWAAGYTVGLLFGPDANALASTSSGVASSDFAVKDANVTLRAPVGNGLDFKVGAFSTILGYEVLEAGANPNYSRSFGYFLEPTTYTGVLASYKVNDVISLSAGIANEGTVNTINARTPIDSKKSYLAGLTLTAPESTGFLKGATAYAAVADGSRTLATGSGLPGAQNQINWYAGATLPTPISGLSVGAAYDYVANAVAHSSYGNAIGAYVSYQATEKLKLNNRMEYATGSYGTFGVPMDPTTGGARLFGETFTADYSLWANVTTRAELRWDHSLNGQRIYNTPGVGGARNALSVALNVIYNF